MKVVKTYDIEEDYCSFEVAKLLKEKGVSFELNPYNSISYLPNGEINYWEDDEDCVISPPLQMIMKWLREVHNQNIIVKAHNNVANLKTLYYTEIQNLLEPTNTGFCVNGCNFKNTYEEACDVSIKYCLENLV